MGFACQRKQLFPLQLQDFMFKDEYVWMFFFSISNFLRQIEPHIKGSRAFTTDPLWAFDHMAWRAITQWSLKRCSPTLIEDLHKHLESQTEQASLCHPQHGASLADHWAAADTKSLLQKNAPSQPFGWLIGCLDYGIVDLSFYSYCEYRWIILSSICPMDESPHWAWFAKLVFFIGQKWRAENQEAKRFHD